MSAAKDILTAMRTPLRIEDFNRVPRIAYFSMEIAIRDEMPIYSGGLGVLAGDLMRSAADLGVAMIGVTLVSRRGYFRQEIDSEGDQRERPDDWDPSRFATHLPASVSVKIGSRDVWIDAWLYGVQTTPAQAVPVLLLDTDVERNARGDRTITDYLYGGDPTYRLKQEMVLGIGGARMLRALGFRIREYHMNEGHSALLSVELLREERERGVSEPQALRAVRLRTNFTTHTPVEAGHDRFPWSLVRELLPDDGEIDRLRQLAGGKDLNMTKLALETSGVVNGVSVVSQQLFGRPIKSVSNGVHSQYWTSAPFAALYDRYVPEWRAEPEFLTRAARIPSVDLLAAHAQAKAVMIAEIRRLTSIVLDPHKPILTFARRMTGYKRPDLLFQDLSILREIAREHPFQIVIAGKAHPHDAQGKQMIRMIHDSARRLSPNVPLIFLPDYGLRLAQFLVAGSDVWLNTPLPPLEASGTSGMKAAHNGVPSLSVLDGWWIDGCIEGVTGWAIDGDAAHHAATLYAKLRNVVLPLYYGDPEGWATVMRGTIVHNASLFNSHRMLRRYAAEVYLGAG